jgi:hypothetical protein
MINDWKNELQALGIALGLITTIAVGLCGLLLFIWWLV